MEAKTLRTIGATLVLAALVVAGIAQARSEQDAGPVAIVTGTTTTTDAEEPTTGHSTEPFTYRVGVLSGISTNNFWAFYGSEPSAWNSYILGPTKPALFTTNGAGASLRPELAVAHAEPAQDDRGWFVTLDLDTELHWSDGSPVTADDVVFTFDTVRTLDLGGSWAESLPDVVEGVEADGDHRLTIRFSERPRLSVWPHGVGTAPIMAAHAWRDAVEVSKPGELYELSGDGDVGGGPLAISDVSDVLIVSSRNHGYPSGHAPDVVEYHVYSSEGAAAEALLDGDIDYVLSPKGMTSEQVKLLAEAPTAGMLTSPGNVVRYLGFNLERKPMSDQAFRTALALLLDRDRLADASPSAQVARSLVPEANSAWFDGEAETAIIAIHGGDFDERLGRALENLRAAGYSWETAPALGPDGGLVAGSGLTKDGTEVAPLTILTSGDAHDPARPEYATAIADTLADLGFDVRPVETDFDTVVDLAFTPGEAGELNYDLYLLGWTLGNPVLPGYYGTLFSADGVMNNTGYASAEFDRAHDSYRDAYTMAEARAALWSMERILAEDLPYLPLYT
ncbi:MAG TPA: ABC transporter substrate-binding protein, partial [Acidimicrobiia bacterium]|nr:ABC transporter substrate-binding protein [Acidimicrobiia bacterium]